MHKLQFCNRNSTENLYSYIFGNNSPSTDQTITVGITVNWLKQQIDPNPISV